MAEPLYTLICDFDGGTYVSQVRARNEQEAVKLWARLVERERPLGDASDDIGRHVVRDDSSSVLLEGLTNVWCLTGEIGGRLLLLNIVLSK